MTKEGSELISFWLPKGIAGMLNDAVNSEDTDRSKFIRAAVRERLAKKRLRRLAAK